MLPVSLLRTLPEAGEEPIACISLGLFDRAAAKLSPLPSPSLVARVQLLKGPVDPEETTSSAPPAPESKILDLGNTAKSPSKQEKQEKEARLIPVMGIREVPEEQIVIVGGMGNGPEEPREWELVRYVRNRWSR